MISKKLPNRKLVLQEFPVDKNITIIQRYLQTQILYQDMESSHEIHNFSYSRIFLIIC